MAAGRGNRLLPLTHDRPKCLVEVGNEPIVLHVLRSLRAAGVPRVELVIGHGAELVKEVVQAAGFTDVTFALNEHFATTSSLFSLGCTHTVPGPEGLLLLNSDVLFHPELIQKLLGDPRTNVLLAEFNGVLGEEEMKITVDADHRITGISKTIDPTLAQAENLGVLKVGQFAAEAMLKLARQPQLGEEEGLCWVPDAIHALRDELDFFALTTGGLPWIEIDYHHDLKRARNEVWPKITTAQAKATLGIL
jgi:choline kinase